MEKIRIDLSNWSARRSLAQKGGLKMAKKSKPKKK